MKDILYTVYTHTDCMDVWPIFFGQTDKHVCESMDKAIFVNKVDENIDRLIPAEYEVYLYDDTMTYTERVLSCLESIRHDYILFHHEDMFLYESPDWSKIKSYVKYMEDNGYDSVRLIKSGEMNGEKLTEDLVDLPESTMFNFVLQPTIIRTNKMVELFSRSKKTNIWDFEVDVQRVCRDIKLKSCYADTSTKKIGGHYESGVYPYIATGIVKGKWNYSEYPEVLDKISNLYDIDMSFRGVR